MKKSAVMTVTIMEFFPLIVVVLMSSALGNAKGNPTIKLTSNAPAILDAQISFKAELLDADGYQGPFFFKWNDDASPGNWIEQETNDKESTWTLSYASKKYEEKQYKMTVRVYTEIAFFREEIAETTIKFDITKQLSGQVVIQQSGSHNHIVASTLDVELKVQLHDPSGFLKDAVMTYFYFVNDTNYGPSDNDTFTYQFTNPGRSTVEAMVMAKVAGDNNPSPPTVNNTAEIRSLTSAQLRAKAPPYVKTGVLRTHVDSRTPITYLNETGETWLTHGRMVELLMLCDGSGPWNTCWDIKPNPYNVTGNESCASDSVAMTDNCSFPVLWYFRDVGIFDILAIADNGISKKIMLIHINVYDVQHQTPLSIVVIPISCSLLAILAIGTGGMMVYAVKRNIAVETADFDFNSPEEQLEYKTFWERLRDSMMNAFGNSSDDVSHVSSVSSRSIQHPITSIHYGSIS